MKIAINKCYGGFGLSKEAIAKLHDTACEHLSRTPKKKWGSFSGWEKQRFPVINGNVVTESHYGNDRSCPYLIQVIEEMGSEKASAELAKLKIVEIPDDINWEIHDYDGMERVDQCHESWY